MRTVFVLVVGILVPLLPACSAVPLPTQPSPSVVAPSVMQLEAEAGQGEGVVRSRSRASGGLTVHLAPGEYRLWTFDVGAAEVQFALSIAYSNGKEGENELLSVSVDGRALVSFQNRDSGDAVEGWNEFVSDPAGTVTLGPGRHTLRLESSGGDGCVEIDVAMLSRAPARIRD
jgi:hypothetical protein